MHSHAQTCAVGGRHVSVKGCTTISCSYVGCPQPAQTCTVGGRHVSVSGSTTCGCSYGCNPQPAQSEVGMSQLKGPPPAADITGSDHSWFRNVQSEVGMSQLKGPPPAAVLTGAAHRRLRYVQSEVHKLVSVKGSTTCSCSYQGCPQPAQTCAVGGT